ncbi:cytochrome P450 [Micromonospora sp. NPDC050187]|uniref:cytochrome P450 n=1 Tax=Micromonospora sp. NPDC050187 TaxID=3364277 RepID=UPI00378D7E0D
MTADNTTEVPTYPFGPVNKLDLHPRYTELRRTEPITRVRMPYGGEAWLITGYTELKQFLADRRFSSLRATEPDTARVTPLPLRKGNLLSMDPPEHTRIRRVVAGAFTKRRIDALAPRIKEVVHEQLDAMAKHGAPADAVEYLAVPVPVTMICELFGIAYEDRDRFRQFSDVFVATSGAPPEEIERSRNELEAYLGELADQRRREPREDLVTTLLEAFERKDRLSETEMLRTGIGILMAGHETSLSMIANVLYLLLAQPELWAQLRDDPRLVPSAIEEMLRIIPLRSVGSFPRVAVEDVEIAGVTIRAGDTVIFQRASADRDERIFENPEEIDLARSHNPHLGFGHGAHHCLGASIARLEIQLVLEGLIGRFPQLRLAVPADEVPWKPGLIARCPSALPVEW